MVGRIVLGDPSPTDAKNNEGRITGWKFILKKHRPHSFFDRDKRSSNVVGRLAPTQLPAHPIRQYTQG